VLDYGLLLMTRFFVLTAALILAPIAPTGFGAFMILLACNLLLMVLSAKLAIRAWRDIRGES
jgi:hypothetical protein